MNIGHPAHGKKQLFRFLFAFTLVLSLFNGAGLVVVSSNRPQKPATEFLWAERQNKLSHSFVYVLKHASANFTWNCNAIKANELKALWIHDQMFFIRFNQLCNQFNCIKPEIMDFTGFKSFQSDKEEPAVS